MKLNMLFALALSLAVGLMPLGALAHEGHDHGAKTKKVKKPKPKKAAVEFVVARRTG